MDGLSIPAILKIVAEYGVLGLGWVAWILTMGYMHQERKRYQSLVIHIISHFTKVSFDEETPELPESAQVGPHQQTFMKLFGGK